MNVKLSSETTWDKILALSCSLYTHHLIIMNKWNYILSASKFLFTERTEIKCQALEVTRDFSTCVQHCTRCTVTEVNAFANVRPEFGFNSSVFQMPRKKSLKSIWLYAFIISNAARQMIFSGKKTMKGTSHAVGLLYNVNTETELDCWYFPYIHYRYFFFLIRLHSIFISSLQLYIPITQQFVPGMHFLHTIAKTTRSKWQLKKDIGWVNSFPPISLL